MASLSFLSSPAFFLAISLWIQLISPTRSQTCTSPKFTNNNVYNNCSELPTLKAYLHYTYNSSNSSLSIAFVAPPAKSDGWIGWGINLNGTKMIGTQALVASKFNGSLAVKTYNLASYDIKPSNLTIDVWDLSAESNSSSGNYILFGSVKVPTNMESLNQIWQVGPSATDGSPEKHEMLSANLNSTGKLALVASATTNSTTTNSGSANNSSDAGYTVRELNMGVYLGLFALVGGLIGF